MLVTLLDNVDLKLSSCDEVKSPAANPPRDGKEMCSRPTTPPTLEARMADSPPTLSYREPTLVRRVVVYVDPVPLFCLCFC